MKEDPNDFLILSDGTKLRKVGAPAAVLDPKQFPAIEHFRQQYQPTTGTAYAVDRLYAEITTLFRQAQENFTI